MSNLKKGLYLVTGEGFREAYEVLSVEATKEGTTVKTKRGIDGYPTIFCSNPNKHAIDTMHLSSYTFTPIPPDIAP